MKGFVARDRIGTIRFWAMYIAVVAVTARIICHKLNLLPWDHIAIKAAGVELIKDTLTVNASTDAEIVSTFRTLVSEQASTQRLTVNNVYRDIQDSATWPHWKTSQTRDRTNQSNWNEGLLSAATTSMANNPPQYEWRVDHFIHPNDPHQGQLVETIAYLPKAKLDLFISRHRHELGVRDAGDLGRALVDGGCVVKGLNGSNYDQASAVTTRIEQDNRHTKSIPRRCVEIRLPPIPLASDT
jgi:hypothetical protein